MLHRHHKDFITRMFAVVSVLAFLAFPLTETIVYLLGNFHWPTSGTPGSGRETAFFFCLAATLYALHHFVQYMCVSLSLYDLCVYIIC